MKTALIQLADDFVSVIAFVLVFAWSGNLTLATAIAIVVALGQAGYGLARKRPASAMRWMGLGLAIGLGCLTLVTHDSRFIRFKPTLAHFAIGAVMLSTWRFELRRDAMRGSKPEFVPIREGRF